MKNALGDRMKENYENRQRFYLIRRMPVIMRLDGVAFHSYTRHMEKPFSLDLSRAMIFTTQHLVDSIQGARCGYTESDEISLLLMDYNKLESDAWFDNNIQKMCSVAASIATYHFNNLMGNGKMALFDCRVFNIPREEVCNYFIDRQNDARRNSVQSFARSHFSQKQLQGKSGPQMLDMLKKKGIDWEDLDPRFKYGTYITRIKLNLTRKNDSDLYSVGNSLFSRNRDIIDSLLIPEEG